MRFSLILSFFAIQLFCSNAFSQSNRLTWLNYKYSDNNCLLMYGTSSISNLLHVTELPFGYKSINIIDNSCPILNTRKTEIYSKPQGFILLWDDSKEPISKDIYDDIKELGINDYLVTKNNIIDTIKNMIINQFIINLYYLLYYIFIIY